MFILSICLVSSLVLDTILLIRIDESVASVDVLDIAINIARTNHHLFIGSQA